jgi:hypothetical protein
MHTGHDGRILIKGVEGVCDIVENLQEFDEHQEVVEAVVDGFVGPMEAVEHFETDFLETLFLGVPFLGRLLRVEFVRWHFTR